MIRDITPVAKQHYDALLAAMRKYRWRGTRRRVALARGAARDRWGYLKVPLKSDRVVRCPIYDLCRAISPTSPSPQSSLTTA